MKPPAHGAVAPALHVPEPSQVPLAVSMPLPQEGEPHEPPGAGYWHAPLESHPVAPHDPPVVHAAVQQLPAAPVVPQTPLAHAPAAEHGWPEERRHWVPPTQVVFGAQPVLGAVHDVAHALPAQANPLGHAPGVGVLQPLPLQTAAAVNVEPVQEAPAQAAQVRPFEPQALFADPERHVPPSGLEQQPPLQSTVVEQVVRHVCAVGSQATFVAQSLPPLHPHDPPNPLVLETHAVPALTPAQLWQAAPFGPQAPADWPFVQVPLAPPSAPAQQPPLQSWVALQALVQAWVAVSHACPSGQSLATSHPQ